LKTLLSSPHTKIETVILNEVKDLRLLFSRLALVSNHAARAPRSLVRCGGATGNIDTAAVAASRLLTPSRRKTAHLSRWAVS
jgi:hypothetical protein